MRLARGGRRLAVIALAGATLAGLPAAGEPPARPPFAAVSPNVPIGDPLYDVLERLSDLGLAPGYLRGVRPFTMAFAAHLIRQAAVLCARRGRPEPALLATARDLLDRLLAHDLGPARVGGTGEAAAGRIDEVTTPSYNSYSGARTGYLLPEAGRGAAPDEGFGLAAAARAALGSFSAAEVAGRLTFPGTGPSGTLTRAYAKLGVGLLELEVGRDDVVFGQGQQSTMVLSGNAGALDQIALRTSRPVRLPWILRYLGDFQAMLFAARLDQELPHAYPTMLGERIVVLPFPWLELGFSRLFVFGGRGAPHFPAARFAEEFLLGWRQNVATQNYSNTSWTWEGRVRVKQWVEVYWEHYVEDCCDSLTRDTAILAGLRRPGLTSWHDDLALEFVASSYIAWVLNDSGEFVQRSRITGNPIGPSGLGAHARWRFVGDEGGLLKARLSLEQRRVPFPQDHPGDVDEWRVGGALEGRLPLRGRRAGRVDARVRLILERVLNAAHVRGDDRTAGLIDMGLEAAF